MHKSKGCMIVCTDNRMCFSGYLCKHIIYPSMYRCKGFSGEAFFPCCQRQLWGESLYTSNLHTWTEAGWSYYLLLAGIRVTPTQLTSEHSIFYPGAAPKQSTSCVEGWEAQLTLSSVMSAEHRTQKNSMLTQVEIKIYNSIILELHFEVLYLSPSDF